MVLGVEMESAAVLVQRYYRSPRSIGRRHRFRMAKAATLIQSYGRIIATKTTMRRDAPALATALADFKSNLEAMGTEAGEAFEAAHKLLVCEQFEEAVVAYDKAAGLGHARPSRCYNGSGLACFGAGQHTEAIRRYGRSIQLDPHDGRTWHNRAAAHASQDRLHKANHDAAKALTLRQFAPPADPTPATDIAECLDEPDRQLWDAAAAGDDVAAVLALGSGADPNCCQRGRTALATAAAAGSEATVRAIAQAEGCDLALTVYTPYTPEWQGETPLHIAARHGHLDAARELLRHEADVNAPIPATGYTPLHNAAAAGHAELCWLMVSKGADLTLRTGEGDRIGTNRWGGALRAKGLTAAGLAAAAGHLETLAVLGDGHGWDAADAAAASLISAACSAALEAGGLPSGREQEVSRLLKKQQKAFAAERMAAASSVAAELAAFRTARLVKVPPLPDGAASPMPLRVVGGGTDSYVPGRVPVFAPAAPPPPRPFFPVQVDYERRAATVLQCQARIWLAHRRVIDRKDELWKLTNIDDMKMVIKVWPAPTKEMACR